MSVTGEVAGAATLGVGGAGPADEEYTQSVLNPQWVMTDVKGKALSARLAVDVFPRLQRAVESCIRAEEAESQDGSNGGDVAAAVEPSVLQEIDHFIAHYSSYERFCEVEEKPWFAEIWTVAAPTVSLLTVSRSEKSDLVGLRLIHILCRDERAFKSVVDHDGIPLILAKLDNQDRLASVVLCRAAMLAIGNITFQLSQDFSPAKDCLPYITRVLKMHMSTCPETSEAALWALANVFYSETLPVTTDVVKLVLNTMTLHRTHISVVCEGVYCLHNFSCSRQHQDMILEMGLVDTLMDCFLMFNSARFVYPAIELVKIYCTVTHRDRAVVQIARRFQDLMHLNQPGTIEPYQFGSSSSYEPRLAMWRDNWRRILTAVADLSPAEQPHPVMRHKRTSATIVSIYQRTESVPSLLELASKHVDGEKYASIIPRPAAALLNRPHKCTYRLCGAMHHRPYAQFLSRRDDADVAKSVVTVHCVCSFKCFLRATRSKYVSDLELLNPSPGMTDVTNRNRRT